MVNPFPVLSVLVFLPLAFAVLHAVLPEKKKLQDTLAVLSSGLLFALSGVFWWQSRLKSTPIVEFKQWFPSLGINYSLGADNLSWVLVLLTTFLVFMSIIASITTITKRHRLYYSMIYVLTASILGVFLARDLFLFFLFWELELIPMYLLIAIWGGPRREFAALKFVLYTLFGSVFMLASILGLYFFSHKALGFGTFDFTLLSQAPQLGLAFTAQILIFIGFFLSFAIKLPMVPFHTWLPDAHVEAPTPVSMLLAGILLKMGSYGLLRFCFAWFPEAATALAPYIVLLGTINIAYTAGVALVQADLKKLIAYSSVSHMGFVLLGLGALNATGFNGAVFQMVSHGLISAGLFMMVGAIYNRIHTRQIAEMGGFGKDWPTIYFFGLLLALASLGLPLLGGFPAETLVFYGAYLSKAFHVIPWFNGSILPLSMQSLTIISATGVIVGAAYLLWMVQRVFMGPMFPKWEGMKDASPSEVYVLSGLSLLVIAIGFFPQWVSGQFDEQVTAMARPYEAKLVTEGPIKQPIALPMIAPAQAQKGGSQ